MICALLLALTLPFALAVHWFTPPESLNTLIGNVYIERAVKSYVQDTSRKLLKLKKLMSTFDQFKHQSSGHLMEHPLAAYGLVRLCAKIKETVADITPLSNFESRMSGIALPSQSDVLIAGMDLQTLQSVYRFNYNDLMDGNVLGHKAPPLTADDKFNIGNTIFHNHQYKNAIPWLFASIRGPVSVHPVNILSTMARCYEKDNDVKSLISTIASMKEILKGNDMLSKYIAHLDLHFNTALRPLKLTDNSDTEIYASLCRRENLKTIPHRIAKCLYRHTSIPYERTKVEVFSVSPYVVFYHGVISQRENTVLTRLSTNALRESLKESTKSGREGNATFTVTVPLTHTAWIHPDRAAILGRVDARMSRITGLSGHDQTSHFEAISYGIASYGVPRVEASTVPDRRGGFPLNQGSVGGMATYALYLKTARAGGHLSFPRAKLSLDVIENGAMFWYNELPSGDKEWLSMQGTCAVIHGSQLVLKKWFDQSAQSDARPCGKERFSSHPSLL